jgi:hypothetical protein
MLASLGGHLSYAQYLSAVSGYDRVLLKAKYVAAAEVEIALRDDVVG